MADAYSEDEAGIKIRFNTLCRQFENNGKYTTFAESQEIDESEDISFEMSVHQKRYEAEYIQAGKEFEVEDVLSKYAIEKVTQEEWDKLSDNEKLELERILLRENKDEILQYGSDIVSNKTVWFMINEEYGEYRI